MTANLSPASEAAVVADGLTKRFGDFVAVDRVSFTVGKGEIYGFLGPNGAGKTTTIRMLLGLLRPTAGRACLLGYDMTREAKMALRSVGYMTQRFSLYGDLSCRENLDFFGQTYGIPRRELPGRRQRAIQLTGLAGYEEVLARDLPGGFRQRLALACAVLHQPEVLLLDEPTAGVDPLSRRAFWDLLYELADQGRTILVTTHYMDEAENCRRLGFLLGGRLVLEGSPGQVKQAMPGQVIEIECDQPEQALIQLRVAADEGRLAAEEVALYGSLIHVVAADARAAQVQIPSLLAAAGIEVMTSGIIPPSLEDVFMSRMRQSSP